MRGSLISTFQLNYLIRTNKNLKLLATALCKPEEETKESQDMLIHQSQRFANLLDVSSVLAARPRGMPTKTQWESFLAKHQLDRNQTIVLFDNPIYLASRLWVTFRHYGMKNVFLLDGGYSKWKSDENKFTNDEIRFEPSNIQYRKNIYLLEVSASQFNMILSNKDIQKYAFMVSEGIHPEITQQFEGIDVRKAEDFNKRYIPGFKNVPMESFLNQDKTFKSDIDIYRVLNSANIQHNKRIIAMCQTGKMASVLSFAFDMIEMQSFLYDESFNGWEAAPPLNDQEKEKIRKQGLKP